jgi:hypothetical protein
MKNPITGVYRSDRWGGRAAFFLVSELKRRSAQEGEEV